MDDVPALRQQSRSTPGASENCPARLSCIFEANFSFTFMQEYDEYDGICGVVLGDPFSAYPSSRPLIMEKLHHPRVNQSRRLSDVNQQQVRRGAGERDRMEESKMM